MPKKSRVAHAEAGDRVMSGRGRGAFQKQVAKTGPIDVSNTGGYPNWVNIPSGGIEPPSRDGEVYVDNVAVTTSSAGGNRTEVRATVTIPDDEGGPA